ncbi:MAG TPA: hypothetical protein VJB59_13795 [Bdellovibrionota bacterium]|nr:hypothetical protein [Bdellovibrionota bacterium]
MNKMILLVLGALVIAAGPAQAVQDSRYYLRCRYTGTTDGKMTPGVSCRAHAALCDFKVTPSETGTQVNPSVCRDELHVQCNEQPVYGGPATHFSSHDGKTQLVRGFATVTNPTPPILSYPTGNPEGETFVISSWLKLDHAVLRGICEVRSPEL